MRRIASTLTKRIIDSAQPREKRFELWDADVGGLGLRVEPSGVKSFVLRYRAGKGRSAPKRYVALGRYGKVTLDQSRTEARRLLGEVANDRDPATERRTAREAEKRGGNTVNDLAEAFLTEHVDVECKPRTAENYRGALDRHIRPVLGTKKAESVTAEDVRRLRYQLRSKPATANLVKAILSKMFAFGAGPGFVPKGFNPTGEIKLYKAPQRRRYLSADELERLGKALREAETVGLPYVVDEAKPKAKHAAKVENRRVVIGSDATNAMRLLLLTGCRLREVLHLRWSEVDLDVGMLHLADSKTGQKTIVLNGPARLILAELPKRGAYVFPGEPRRRAGEEQKEQPRADLNRPWRSISRAAGLVDLRIHDLRHSHASVGAAAGLSLPLIGAILGHRQQSTTQRYSHLSVDPVRAASERIGAVIAGGLTGGGAGEVLPLERRRG